MTIDWPSSYSQIQIGDYMYSRKCSQDTKFNFTSYTYVQKIYLSTQLCRPTMNGCKMYREETEILLLQSLFSSTKFLEVLANLICPRSPHIFNAGERNNEMSVFICGAKSKILIRASFTQGWGKLPPLTNFHNLKCIFLAQQFYIHIIR